MAISLAIYNPIALSSAKTNFRVTLHPSFADDYFPVKWGDSQRRGGQALGCIIGLNAKHRVQVIRLFLYYEVQYPYGPSICI